MQVDGKEWFLGISRNMPFWIMYLGAEGNYSFQKDFGIDSKAEEWFVSVNGVQTHAFFEKNQIREYGNAVMQAVSSEKKIKELKKKYLTLSKQFVNSFKKCRKEFNAENWRQFQDEDQRFSAGLLITAIIGRNGSEQLTEMLEKKGFSENETNQVISVITYPREHTPLFKSQLDLLKIGAIIQASKPQEKEINAMLKKWLRKHSFIPVNFCDQPWTMQDAKSQLENCLKKDCANEVRELKAGHEKKLEQAKNLLKKIKDKKIRVLAHAIAEGTYLNEFRKNVFSKIYLKCRPLLKKIAGKAGSKDFRDCYYCTPEELNEIMEGKLVDLRKIVAQRKLMGCKRGEDGKLQFIQEPLLSELNKFVQSALGKSIVEGQVLEKQVSGMIGNSGKITAEAKIVLSSKDFHKVSSGDIIVATMTSVDFVPVMKIAGGFITNEGGITCHAAIVAREMNKPCLIGTKNATRVFTDGDRIELDATNGVAKKIS